MQVKNVVIVNDFNFIQGGASKVAIDTANLFAKNYNDIKVYFFSAVQNGEEILDKKIINICTDQNEALKDQNKIRGICNGLYNFKAKKVFKELLKTLDKNSTIIHIHGWTKALSSSVFDIAFKMNFKVVLTLHDYFSSCPNGGYFDYKKNQICERKALSLKCIMCNCDSRNYFFKLYRLIRHFIQNKIVKMNSKVKYAIGISDLSIKILQSTFENAKIEKIYNPINLEMSSDIDYDNKENYFLYVGRVSKEKGVDIFCRIITELNLTGIVVGEGATLDDLKKEYPNIKFVGWKSEKEVSRYMKNAKALIFTSVWYETAGLTVLEAKQNNLKALVPSWCASKEFVKEEFVYNSTEELKEKILNIDNMRIEDNYYDLDFSEQSYMREILKVYIM